LFGNDTKESASKEALDEPISPLEQMLKDFFTDNVDRQALFHELINANFVVPCEDEEVSQLLDVSSGGGAPLFVFLTAEERMVYLGKDVRRIKKLAQVNLGDFIASIPEPEAIVINPGWKYSVMLPRDQVKRIHQRLKVVSYTLEGLAKDYLSGKIALSELISHLMRSQIGIALKRPDAMVLEGNMASQVQNGKHYYCIFSSTEFVEIYRENHPEFIHTASNVGELIIMGLPRDGDGVVLNPDSSHEIVINNGSLQIAKMLQK